MEFQESYKHIMNPPILHPQKPIPMSQKDVPPPQFANQPQISFQNMPIPANQGVPPQKLEFEPDEPYQPHQPNQPGNPNRQNQPRNPNQTYPEFYQPAEQGNPQMMNVQHPAQQPPQQPNEAIRMMTPMAPPNSVKNPQKTREQQIAEEYPNLDVGPDHQKNQIFTYGMPKNYKPTEPQKNTEKPGMKEIQIRHPPRIIMKTQPVAQGNPNQPGQKPKVVKMTMVQETSLTSNTVKRTVRRTQGGRDKVSSIKNEISNLKNKLKKFENKFKK